MDYVGKKPFNYCGFVNHIQYHIGLVMVVEKLCTLNGRIVMENNIINIFERVIEDLKNDYGQYMQYT